MPRHRLSVMRADFRCFSPSIRVVLTARLIRTDSWPSSVWHPLHVDIRRNLRDRRPDIEWKTGRNAKMGKTDNWQKK